MRRAPGVEESPHEVTEPAFAGSVDARAVLALQRTAGNAAVTRLLRRAAPSRALLQRVPIPVPQILWQMQLPHVIDTQQYTEERLWQVYEALHNMADLVLSV
ncbi:MAG: hypothetical protein ACJ8H8_32585, partial [Geminicoccaceae bacterium]